jgi:hypothetical protein
MKVRNYVHLDTKSKKIDKETKFAMRREKRGVDIPLDLTSDDYRCCPQCIIGFMADNEKQIFCCQKCHDDYNNAKRKRKLKEMKAKLEEVQELYDVFIPFKKNRIMQLKWSEAFLEKIHPCDNTELAYPRERLLMNGVDLNVFEGDKTVVVLSDGIRRYAIAIRSFIIYYNSKKWAIIKKQKKERSTN